MSSLLPPPPPPASSPTTLPPIPFTYQHIPTPNPPWTFMTPAYQQPSLPYSLPQLQPQVLTTTPIQNHNQHSNQPSYNLRLTPSVSSHCHSYINPVTNNQSQNPQRYEGALLESIPSYFLWALMEAGLIHTISWKLKGNFKVLCGLV
jgi:hypothetical protein